MLKTDYSFFLILLIIPFSAGITYLFYRKVKISKPLKYLLSWLRFLFITLLLFLFLNPVVRSLSESEYKPLNIFLIDVSQSMQVSQRDSVLKNVILPSLFGKIPEGKYFLFSEDLLEEFRGDISQIFNRGSGITKSDLSKTLSSLRKIFSPEDISSITVISDGIYNSGESAMLTAEMLDSKINYILVGDTANFKDRSISGINYNKISYSNSFPEVTANIFSKGISGKFEVKLFEENTLIDSKEVITSPDLTNYTVSFFLPNSNEGVFKYTIEIPTSNQELSYKNNKEIFYIKRIDITPDALVLSGGPDADYAFFSEEIKKLKNLKVTFLTQKSAETYYEGDLSGISKINCIIFFGYPGRLTSEKDISLLKSKLGKNTPLIFFNSVTTDFDKLKNFEEFLPFKIENIPLSYYQSGIRFVSNLDERFAFLKGIENFPPLNVESGAIRFKPDSEILLVSSAGIPVYGLRNSNFKSSGFTAYGLLKWKLNKGNYDYTKAFSGIITETINLLLEPKKNRPLNVETSKDIYNKSEPVKFFAEVGDDYVNTGKKVNVKSTGSIDNFSIELTEVITGKYSGSSEILKEGDYRFVADYEATGNEILSDNGRFTVGEDNFEFRNLFPENKLLNELIAIKGGKNLTGFSSAEITEFFNQKPEKKFKKIKYEDIVNFRENIYFLLFIIFLISLEWFIRKKFNLP